MKQFLNIVSNDIKCKTIVASEEILLSAAAATVPCILFDHLIHAIHNWQRSRAGVVSTGEFGALGRTLISLLLNFGVSGLLSYLYHVIGHEPSDAFLIAACLWLMVSVPVLLTSRYIDESQRQFLASRILGWLVKTAIAAVAAEYFITLQ